MTTYRIDQEDILIKTEVNSFYTGKHVVLAHLFDDPVLGFSWKEDGYAIRHIGGREWYNALKKDVHRIVRNAVHRVAGKDYLGEESLIEYHRVVPRQFHKEVDAVVKRSALSDFSCSFDCILEGLSKEGKCSLSFFNRYLKQDHWIIIRICPPASTGSRAANPPHKDIYEEYDQTGSIGRMMNIWIPIENVNVKSSLPVVRGSHLFPESEILRTHAGCHIDGADYSVNCIESWHGNREMTRIVPNEGEMLVFSSHLIHGLAVNMTAGTRVALELRVHS